MTTRLVNNVFQITTHTSDGPGYISALNSGSNPSGGLPGRVKTSNGVQSATILIGSGVGTEDFDNFIKSQKRSYDDANAVLPKGKGKGGGEQTYAVPMQVRVTRDEDRAV